MRRRIIVACIMLAVLGAMYAVYILAVLPLWLAPERQFSLLLDDDSVERFVWNADDVEFREIDLRRGRIVLRMTYRGEGFDILDWEPGSEIEVSSKDSAITAETKLSDGFRLVETPALGTVAIADSARICVTHVSPQPFANRELAREFVAGVRLRGVENGSGID